MILYKYVTLARIDVLKRGMIRFTQPAALNDPFETNPNWAEYAKQLFDSMTEMAVKAFGPLGHLAKSNFSMAGRRELIRQKLAKMRRMWGDDVAILCMSKIKNNLLMWAHYADEHRGFVIGFDGGHPFFNRPDATPMGELRAVDYFTDRWVMPSGGLISLQGEDRQAALVSFFFRKSKEWKYEKEVRLIHEPKRADKTLEKNGQKLYLYAIPPECIKEVVLGCEMDEHTEREIVDILATKYPKVRLFQAFEHDSQFKLDFVRYPLDLKERHAANMNKLRKRLG
jgi:hypothetical protein